MDKLQLMLGKLAGEGEIESSGSFTVSMERAVDKLRAFRLPGKGDYVLKLVQAAVAARAEAVHIKINRTTVQVRFGLDEPLPIEELLPAMAVAEVGLAGAMGHLVTGLRAALGVKYRSLFFGYWGPGESAAFVLENGQLKRSNDARPPGGPAVAGQHQYCFRLIKPWAWTLTSPNTLEAAAVAECCGFAPVDLSVDGRTVRDIVRAPAPASWHKELTVAYNLFEWYEVTPGGPLRVQGPSPRERRLDSGVSRSTRKSPLDLGEPLPPWLVYTGDFSLEEASVGGPIPCRFASRLEVGLEGPARVALVREGVVVTTLVLFKAGAGAWAVASADRLRYDLSGFGVIRDEAFEALTEEVVTSWRRMADLLLNSQVDPPIQRPPDAHKKENPAQALSSLFDALTGEGIKKAAREVQRTMKARLTSAEWY
ncbi:MAG: hypothetical protein AB7S38_19660 [Vulcanimicrobiota bacterium]